MEHLNLTGGWPLAREAIGKPFQGSEPTGRESSERCTPDPPGSWKETPPEGSPVLLNTTSAELGNSSQHVQKVTGIRALSLNGTVKARRNMPSIVYQRRNPNDHTISSSWHYPSSPYSPYPVLRTCNLPIRSVIACCTAAVSTLSAIPNEANKASTEYSLSVRSKQADAQHFNCAGLPLQTWRGAPVQLLCAVSTLRKNAEFAKVNETSPYSVQLEPGESFVAGTGY